MPPVLVLDTNVLIAALRSSRGASYALLGMVGRGQFDLGLTAALVLEYEDVCMRALDALTLTPNEVRLLLDHLCQVGRRSAVYFRTRPSLPDPGDELVLEAAVASGSEWIVTHNVRDLAAGSARFGIEVLTPAEALRRLGVQR